MAAKTTPQTRTGCQDEVLRFLASPSAHGTTGPVERIDTHAAVVFLAGDRAVKIKKAVKLPYLDFSTLERRHNALAQEHATNRPNAPEVYLQVAPIVRGPQGRSVGGDGEVIEWALIMNRFDQDQLLDRLAGQGPLDARLVDELADVIVAAHRRAPAAAAPDCVAAMGRLVDQFAGALAGHARLVGEAEARAFRPAAERALRRAAPVLAARAEAGLVRRCHGDFHLGNIVLIKDKPVLFDALEFDEALATVDVLHDLAFLLMDLMHRGQRPAANRLLNRYLQRQPGNEAGLAAMPLFLGLRAAVRAVVICDRISQASRARQGRSAEAADYLRAALAFLDPPPARLIAIGGLSGTGKSTLAARLAPDIGAAPGAVHLRSDVERKTLFGVEETARLDSSCYDMATTARVYRIIAERARSVAEAGHSVVADAVYGRLEERQAIEAVAHETGAAFTGLWLTAPRETLIQRVGARRNDASDATPDVVAKQVERWPARTEWHTVDASGSVDAVLRAARSVLEGKSPPLNSDT